MKILITGGAGFIGTHLASYLAKTTIHSITIVDNLRRGNMDKLARERDRFILVRGDIRDRDLMCKVMNGVDIVFHLAAQSNVVGAISDLDYSFSSNVVGTFNVLSAAKLAGVQRVIFTSSREVYGEQECLPVSESARLNPKNAYGVSKLAGEAYCRVFQSAGLLVTIVRLANVFGPGDRGRVIPIFTEDALHGRPLLLYGGDQVLDFIWVGTVVEALGRAIETPYFENPVNVGSGTGIAIRDLARIVIEKTRSTSVLHTEPTRSFETSGFIADNLAAVRLGLMTPIADPLEHLQSVIDEFRSSFDENLSLPANVSLRQ